MLTRLRAALAHPATQCAILFEIGLILRCYYLDATPFWYDESFTAVLVQLPFAQLLNATAGDVHPPLYYLLLSLWGWINQGYTPLILRQFSVIFSCLALWQVERLCNAYKLDHRTTLTVLAMAAFSPVLIYYAQEARMYALLQFLVLTVWIAVIKRQWVLIAISTTALMYTHNYGIIYAACLGLVALGYAVIEPRPSYRHGQSELAGTKIPQVLAAFGVPLLAYVPWFAFGLLSQFGKMGADHWLQLVSIWSQIIGTTSLLVGTKTPIEVNLMISALAIGTAIPLIISTLKARRIDWLIMLLGPIAIASAISLWKVIYLTRALTPLLPAGYLIIAAALWRTQWHQHIALKATAAACVLIGLLSIIGTANNGTAKYNPLTAQADVTLKGDVPIIHIGDFTAINWMASRPGTTNYLYLSACPRLPGELEPRTRSAMNVPTITADQFPPEYYLVTYVGNLSNKCQEDQSIEMTTSLQQIQYNPLQWGYSGVYYHAKTPLH